MRVGASVVEMEPIELELIYKQGVGGDLEDWTHKPLVTPNRQEGRRVKRRVVRVEECGRSDLQIAYSAVIESDPKWLIPRYPGQRSTRSAYVADDFKRPTDEAATAVSSHDRASPNEFTLPPLSARSTGAKSQPSQTALFESMHKTETKTRTNTVVTRKTH